MIEKELNHDEIIDKGDEDILVPRTPTSQRQQRFRRQPSLQNDEEFDDLIISPPR